MDKFVLLLLLLVAALIVCFGIDAATDESVTMATVITSLQHLLDYYRRQHPAFQQQQQQPAVVTGAKFDVDSTFGLRVLEGQSKLLVNAYEHGELEFVGSDGDTIRKVVALGNEAGRLANMAMPHIHESDRKRFVLFAGLIDGPFQVVRHQHRVVNPSPGKVGRPPTTLPFDDFDRGLVDRCYGELLVTMATSSKQKWIKKKTKCYPSAECLMTMSSSGQSGHRLQRQIFYTILAEKTGCERQINEYLVSRTRFHSVDEMRHEFCTNAFFELEELSMAAAIEDDHIRDLFLEMEFNCPSVGYFQFMKMEWLQTIVAWQSAEGCVPKMDNERHESRVDVKPAEELVRMHGGYNHVAAPYFEVGRQASPRLNVAAPLPERLRPYDRAPLPNAAVMRSNFEIPIKVGNRGSRSVDSQTVAGQPFRVKKMAGGCESRLTSMVMRALAMYLRYLLDPGPPEFLHLRIENLLKMPNKGSALQDGRTYLQKIQIHERQPTLPLPPSSSSSKHSPIATTSAGRIDLNHLASQAWNFMGTYQRQWGPRFRPIPMAVDNRHVQSVSDLIHRAEVTRELPDWTISLSKTTTTTTTTKVTATTAISATGLSRVQRPPSRRPSKVPGDGISDPSQAKKVATAVHIIRIPSPFQSDLDSYLVVVALVSTACLIAFLRYFRCRLQTTSNGNGKCKTRHL